MLVRLPSDLSYISICVEELKAEVAKKDQHIAKLMKVKQEKDDVSVQVSVDQASTSTQKGIVHVHVLARVELYQIL